MHCWKGLNCYKNGLIEYVAYFKQKMLRLEWEKYGEHYLFDENGLLEHHKFYTETQEYDITAGRR